MQASLATQNCPCFYSSLIANRTFQKGSLLCCFFYYYFYGRDVSCVSLFSQNFRGDPDIFNREFSLEEPAPDHFHNIHRVADRLSPSLDRQSVLATVEVHHNRSRIRHQRLLPNKHGIWRNLAPRPLYTRSLLASLWSVLHSLCAGLMMLAFGLVLYLFTHC